MDEFDIALSFVIAFSIIAGLAIGTIMCVIKKKNN